MSKPIIVGITHGDINGVGYEVILKSLASEGMLELLTPVVFGYKKYIEKARAAFCPDFHQIAVVRNASDIERGRINVIEPDCEMPALNPGTIDAAAGKAAVAALDKAVAALEKGDIDVLVTAPINKDAVQSEQFHFPGHTEYLDDKIGDGTGATMILFDDRLKVALVTTHLPVAKIAENITGEKIKSRIKSLDRSMRRDFGVERPKIGVLSLNPHAGDNGLLGTEESEIIEPAIIECQKEKKIVFGPYAADGYFASGTSQKFDCTLAMYHDQGLAPFKALAGANGVNYTAGLKYVRTSPDHGTAFDIAWKGVADPGSMRQAIFAAIDIYRNRCNYDAASRNPLRKARLEKTSDKTVDLTKDDASL